MDAEQRVLAGPDSAGRPARSCCQTLQLGDAVLLRNLGVDAFASLELEDPAPHSHGLPRLADQPHIDAPGIDIVGGKVLKAVEIERATKFTIDPDQEIEIEGSRDAS